MTRPFERLTETELADELEALEERLAGRAGESRLRKLVQNLRVHQIELEMQNRELREAHHSLEEARDRYADLYDFAPIGYATLDAQGVIREINLTGAAMLGKPRGHILGKPFATSLGAGQSKTFFRHLNRAFDDDAKTTVELLLRRPDGGTRWVLLESVRARSDDSTVCRTAILDVTGRREAERRQRESEDRLMLIADHVPVLIAYVDADRRYVFNNAAYELWFGHSRDYMRGRHMSEILGEDAYAAVRPYVDAALRGEETRFEAEVSYDTAGRRYISGSYIPHRDAAGRVAGLFVLISDLSERHRAEYALEEEQKFVSAVLSTAGALVIVVDSAGLVVRFNRECERVTGYSAEEMLGKRFELLLLPEERPVVEEVFASLSAGDFPNTHENHWVARDGTVKLIAWANTALTDAQGNVTHVIAIGLDVTEQRRMEQELRRQEHQLRVVTNAIPVLIAYVDRDMRYRFVNAAYRDWYGVDPQQMVGRSVEEFADSEAVAKLRAFAKRAFSGEEVFFENTIVHRRRGKRQVSANLVPDFGPDGGVNGYFSVVVDITERKRTEDLDKRRLLEAAHTNRISTIGEMTTEIAHELNQPLTAIATTADVCVEQAKRLPDGAGNILADALGEISGQAHRAAQIIKHVRTFARRREPEFVPVELKSIIDSALTLVNVEARSNDVSIETAVDGSTVVEADPVLVEQLIVNLVRNAIEEMISAGIEAPRVRVAASESNGNVDIIVSDNGPGLRQSTMKHMFQPFHTTKPEGMGLGLAICKSIVEAHGGRIWANTSPRGGAEFGFRLKKDQKRGSKGRGE